MWFKVKEAMVFNSDDDVDELIDIKGWSDKRYAKNIRTLYRSIASEDIINYFEVRKRDDAGTSLFKHSGWHCIV